METSRPHRSGGEGLDAGGSWGQVSEPRPAHFPQLGLLGAAKGLRHALDAVRPSCPWFPYLSCTLPPVTWGTEPDYPPLSTGMCP